MPADDRGALAENSFSQTQVDAPCECAERLAALAKRPQEIENALNLTKKPAFTQLDADSPKDQPPVESKADSALD